MSIRLLWRRGLLALAGAAAFAVAVPAVASASTTLSTSDTSGVPAGSTSTSVTLTYSFSSPTANVTTELPPGLLANGTINGGACFVTPASGAPPAGCKVGSGTANGTPVDFFLVAPPHTGDLAGLEVLAGSTNLAVADVTSRSASDPAGVGLNFAFTGLAAPLSSLTATLTDLRMPTSCPSPAANISVTADSGNASAAFPVTGCSSLAFNPSIAATVIKQSGSSEAEVITTTSQPNALSEAATKTLELGIPSSVTPNVTAVATCFAGSPCTIGTATATSPLLPSAALGSGTVTLGGLLTSPTLTISFPAVNLTLTGSFNSTFTAITFSNVPDIPLSQLSVNVTGTSAGKAFVTDCSASQATATFTAWSGAVKSPTAPIVYQGCPGGGGAGKPTASGSLSGLATGHPTLKFKLTRGSSAPKISSFSIGPSQGLSFRKCVKTGSKHLCAGVSVSGATVKSEKISGGRLTITLASGANSVSVKATGPALSESKSLQSKVKKGKIKQITFSIKVTDASGKTSTVSLKLKG